MWAFEKADFAEVNRLLFSANWSSVTSDPDMDAAWDAWKSVFSPLSPPRFHQNALAGLVLSLLECHLV